MLGDESNSSSVECAGEETPRQIRGGGVNGAARRFEQRQRLIGDLGKNEGGSEQCKPEGGVDRE